MHLDYESFNVWVQSPDLSDLGSRAGLEPASSFCRNLLPVLLPVPLPVLLLIHNLPETYLVATETPDLLEIPKGS